MWELDHREGSVLKNWWFWIVVLGKTLESPLDCKERKPVNTKGNQSWIFIGRTDAEAPILWSPDAKSRLIGKDPDAEKGWRQEQKGTAEDEVVGWHHWLNGYEFEQALVDGEGQGSLTVLVHGVTKSWTWVSDWTRIAQLLKRSVQFSWSVVSDSLWTHGLQHARHPCPSPTSGVYPNSCPLSQRYHPTISSSVIPFSSCPQSFPASGSFQMSQFFPSGGQSIGVSASTSVLPMNTQDWSPLGWTGWISFQSKGLSRVFSNTTVQKHSLALSFLYSPILTSTHDYWKNHSFGKTDLWWQSNVSDF